MRINVLFQDNDENIKITRNADDNRIPVWFGDIQTITESDYNKLNNKPSINSVVIQGALNARDLGLGNVYYDTSANWEAQRDLVSEEAAIYIYSDYQIYEDGVGNQIPIAGIKIGDGTSYLVDMPFVTDAMTSTLVNHIANNVVHITQAEREFWNNKVSAYMDQGTAETLILSRTHYEKDGEIIEG